jgi:hypothetical protein
MAGQSAWTPGPAPRVTPPDYRALVAQQAAQIGLDPALVDRLVTQESKYDPTARSPKGALGIMQLMPDTAKALGVDPNDPVQNIKGGLTYLSSLLKRYGGDTRKAVAAYNAGPDAVDKHGGVPPFKETQDYVQRITGAAQDSPRGGELRADGTPKGQGFFGVLPRPDGKVSTEISIGVNLDGNEVEIPTLVPTLTEHERQWLLTHDVSDPKALPPAIVEKATAFARERLAAGKSPFAQADESPTAASAAPTTNGWTPGPAPAAEPGGAMNFAIVNGQRVPVDGTEPERTWSDTAKDVAIGAAKGVGNTVLGALEATNKYLPGVRVASDAVQQLAFGSVVPTDPMFSEARKKLEPTNTPQQVGYTGEQVGEFFVPLSKAGKAVNVAKDIGLTLAQSGSPTQAGISGALSVAFPGAGGIAKTLSGKLQGSAEKSMAQALGATKEWAKAEAAKLAPQMLKRGVGGSREAMLSTAKQAAKRVGAELDAAYSAAASAGGTVPSSIIHGNLQVAADALKVPDASGVLRIVPGTEHVVQKLDELASFVTSLGADIPVDKAAHVKRVWDRIVSKAGLFGPKATASATDNANAWAVREASNSFRAILNSDPTIAALNKEAGFWIGLKNVLKETEKRTQAQRGGLTDAIRGAGGAAAGAVAGGPVGAAVGGIASQQLSKLLASPSWKTRVSGPLKQQLADALASGNQGRVVAAIGRITTSIPAQFRLAPTQ